MNTNNNASLSASLGLAYTQTKQKQIPKSAELHQSFKTTTNLAHGLTKERVTIQNELQKIGQTKSLLEEMRVASKSKKVEPILTAEEKSSKVNKAEIKGTGFQMKMVQSLKGAEMIEAQRDSRRQRHIACLKEAEKFVDQFYDNFSEKKSEIKERTNQFLERSDVDVEALMAGLSDELLLANEIGYVNGVWEKVTKQRKQRQEEVQNLRNSLDNLRTFQEKGSGSYLGGMRQKLILIAFYLEPQVDELMKKQVEDENAKYAIEHQECDQFYQGVVEHESQKFDLLYNEWKEAVVRFHKIKQDDAIRRFVDRLNSKEFVNPQTRVDLFAQMKVEQQKLYDQRVSLINQLSETHPKHLTKDYVNNINDQLAQFNEESSIMFDQLVTSLTKDMENTNEDIDIALYDLKDFLIKNDAQLDEGITFDIIIENKAMPYVERRKSESKALIMNSIAYQEDFDYKMEQIAQNIVNFFKEFATCLDKNKDKLKQTEINFQVSLANCGDKHDDIVQNQEDDLSKKVHEMERAIHHVMLNEKLTECFDLLDQIQRTYRNYNDEYIEIVKNYPNRMDTFFEEFEEGSLAVFKRYPESQRERIQELYEKETQVAQEKLEAEALKKFEEEKKAEEAKAAEEVKKDPKAKPKAPPAKKGGKVDDKPQLDVPKLEVPEIHEYESKMGKCYLVERSLTDVAEKLLTPAPLEDEANQQDADKAAETDGEQENASPDGAATPGTPKEKAKETPDPAEGEEGEEKPEEPEKHRYQIPDVIENDHLEKAAMLPPLDPEGENTLVADLVVKQERTIEILTNALEVVLDWLVAEKQKYNQKCIDEGKVLQDQSVEELDENLRKQWPRKGRLEVEIFQERKSQITSHNRKYERQVRTCLDKYNALEEDWGQVLDKLQEEFESYQATINRLQENLPTGKNLAQLQGTSRREKDSLQSFDEKCREIKERLDDISYLQPDLLVHQNQEMLKSCQLFEAGGNYDKAEIEWYQGQMDEINDMIVKCKEARLQRVEELVQEIERLKVEPDSEFNVAYKSSIEELSAKDGLGKTYGQPRRFAQERLRSEMTKCEEAQKGVDKLLEELEMLNFQALNGYSQETDYSKEKKSLSIQIRITLVSLVRMMVHYGKHLGGFKPVDGQPNAPEDLQRISYLEIQEGIELQESEIEIDETRKADELEHLGTIGFKNSSQQYLRFPEAILEIDKTCKDLVTKLYTGDNAKHLVGDDKIPEYLSIFLDNMHRQVEEFKINSVRQLRMSSERLIAICQEVPRSVFFYLQFKYANLTLNRIGTETDQFQIKQKEDKEAKDEHLRLFRPNLENPANKDATAALNQRELTRSAAMKDQIDETQVQLLTIEEELSQQFYTAYLNNVRALIKVFDSLLPKGSFIMLPGDEIIEKKHANIKMLTAQMQSADLSKRKTRKWPGLGDPPFKVDYEKLFPQYKAEKVGEDAVPPANPPPADEKTNEIKSEIEVQNTDQHKMIIKARNEFYLAFKSRFEQSIQDIMSEYDELRKEEHRFSNYWATNLEEITKKHI